MQSLKYIKIMNDKYLHMNYLYYPWSDHRVAHSSLAVRVFVEYPARFSCFFFTEAPLSTACLCVQRTHSYAYKRHKILKTTAATFIEFYYWSCIQSLVWTSTLLEKFTFFPPEAKTKKVKVRRKRRRRSKTINVFELDCNRIKFDEPKRREKMENMSQETCNGKTWSHLMIPSILCGV